MDFIMQNTRKARETSEKRMFKQMVKWIGQRIAEWKLSNVQGLNLLLARFAYYRLINIDTRGREYQTYSHEEE